MNPPLSSTCRTVRANSLRRTRRPGAEGAFQQTFERPGLAFDARSGSFVLAWRQGAAVLIQGEGLPALWTARAPGNGFTVSQNGAAATIRVEVIGARGSTQWRSTIGAAIHEHDSLYKLVNTLWRQH